MKYKILHIEDRVEDAELVNMAISEKNSAVIIHHAQTKDDYVDYLLNNKYEVIIADYNVPGLDEHEALTLAKLHQPLTPFIVLSSAIGEENAVELLRLGANDYLLKDNLRKLPFVINRLFEEGRQEREKFLQDAMTQKLARMNGSKADQTNELMELLFKLLSNIINVKCLKLVGLDEYDEYEVLYSSDPDIQGPLYEQEEIYYDKVAEAFSTNGIVRMHDTTDEAEVSVKLLEEVVVPVLVNNKTKGAVLYQLNEGSKFLNEDFSFMKLVSEQVGIYLEKLYLNQELVQKQEELMKYQSRLLSIQINPHFIFNLLNSVQYHILENDIASSVNYVSDFSNLIRAVLVNSMHDFISLQNEINWLKKYLEIEQARLQNKFEFEIRFEDNLDQNNIMIPPMLLQPFVENSIVHGISPMKSDEKGQINIVVRKADGAILIDIDDNGIGRERAAQLKQMREGVKEHNSLAMSITETKISLLNGTSGKGYEMHVDDKKHSDGSSCGTLVRIKMPDDLT